MSEHPFFTRPSEISVGKTLGAYVLERLSEQHASGPVFLARHTQAATTHRLRFLALPAGLSAEQRLIYLGHFQREAGQVALLHHPALLPLNDYGIYQNTPYLVVPDLPGSARSLHTQLMAEGPADLARVGYVLDGIAAALAYVHQHGILHLHLNTGTIFLQTDGQVLLTDTGLLRMLAAPAGASAAAPATLENGSPLLLDREGRPLYALGLSSAPAPELLLGQAPGTSTDVYALGALLYHLLTGHRILRARTLPELAQLHLNAPLPPLHTWRQGLPGDLDRIIGLAMAKDPAQRLRTPQALASAYAAVVSPGTGGRRPPGRVVPPSPAPQENPPRVTPNGRTPVSRRHALTLLAAGGGVAAVGAAAWLIEGNRARAGNASNPGASSGGNVLARTLDVPPNSARSFPLPGSSNPGLLIHLEGGQFVAFHSTCTHAGCAVQYNGQNHLLACPCHGALFDPAHNARVVRGPASSPLPPVPITVHADGTITRNE